MTHIRLFLIVGILTLFSKNLQSFASGACTGKDLAQVQKKLLKVNEKVKAGGKHLWSQFRNSFEGRRACLKIEETYDIGDTALAILIKRWSEVTDLIPFKKTDPDFYQFIATSPNGTQLDTDLIELKELATKKCPPALTDFCAKLTSACDTALSEIETPK